MRTGFNRARSAAMLLLSSLMLIGILAALPMAARADEPIVIGPPIIKKDPPKPKKDQALPTTGDAVLALSIGSASR